MNERAYSPHSRTERPSRFVRGLRHLARGEGGTALVEFALVLLPLALIIFGGIDFGFVFNDVISVRQGVSDAAREAAVGQFGGTTSCGLTSLTGPGASNTQTQELMCTVHNLIGLDSSVTRVAIDVGDNTHQGTFAGPTDPNGPQPITICVQYRVHSVTGMLKPLIDGKVATSTATDMIEVSGVSSAPNTANETQFSSSTPWPSACTNGPPPA